MSGPSTRADCRATPPLGRWTPPQQGPSALAETRVLDAACPSARNCAARASRLTERPKLISVSRASRAAGSNADTSRVDGSNGTGSDAGSSAGSVSSRPSAASSRSPGESSPSTRSSPMAGTGRAGPSLPHWYRSRRHPARCAAAPHTSARPAGRRREGPRPRSRPRAAPPRPARPRTRPAPPATSATAPTAASPAGPRPTPPERAQHPDGERRSRAELRLPRRSPHTALLSRHGGDVHGQHMGATPAGRGGRSGGGSRRCCPPAADEETKCPAAWSRSLYAPAAASSPWMAKPDLSSITEPRYHI